ncbi:Rab family GTPase [Novosphingobium olei]|uniref:GTPase domain-containing protein n=1 Tax=Novosphingobium olei TaxID=2728851 RepID=A0A7Y0BMC9_9SPHN|nr:GTPase domain-containing protein [Novosphingobium olei]NML92845.1 GTPase domain-containing protein [Novosphingobium olei]
MKWFADQAQQAKSLWEQILVFFTGKKIAVLGPRASGKTTLITFLLNGELPEEYFATAKPEKIAGRKVRLGDLALTVQAVTDVPGDTQSHAEWERQYNAADIAFYMVDASKIHAGDDTYIKLITGEMRHIGEWLESRKQKPPKFFLVATHCDLIPDYASLASSRVTGFKDAFWKAPVLQQLIFLAGGSKHVKCAAGSLRDANGSNELVGEILHQVIA